MSENLRILRVNDRELLKGVAGLCTDLQVSESAELNFGLPCQHLRLKAAEFEGHKDIKKISEDNVQILRSITIPLKQLGNANLSISVDSQKGLQITIPWPNPQQHKVSVADATNVLSCIKKRFTVFDTDAAIETALGKERSDLLKIQYEISNGLQRATQASIEQNDKLRQKLERDAEVKKEKLEREFADKFLRKKEELDAQVQAARARQIEYEAKAAELNDRDARHERRKIREDLKEAFGDLSQRFSLTQDTQAKRKPIHAIFIALISFLAFKVIGVVDLVSRQLADVSTATPADATTQIAIRGVAAVGLVAATIYYLRWNDAWFRQHAQEEFRLKRMALDVDRASWVVEMAMEWAKERSDEGLPEQLLDRLTAELFHDSSSDHYAKHPAESILDVLAASAEVEVPLGRRGYARITKQSRKKADKG